MKKHILLNALFIITVCLSSLVNANTTGINLAGDITTTPLTQTKESWFIKEFTRSFLSVYQNKTFVITQDKKPVLLGPQDITQKTKWLDETAKEEFQDYILTPKPGYKGLLIHYQGKPIGTILYRLLENEKTLYLAQYFILPEYQKKGIGVYLLTQVLPSLHPEFKRFDVLARHQNDAALLMYKKAGFTIGNIDLVNKYDYDPLRYMSFYKILN